MGGRVLGAGCPGSSTLLIRDAKIPLRGNELVEASILVANGRIELIAKDPKRLGRADEVIDARGLIAVPGGIDIHAHIYDPDYTHHEDFRSGTAAAAFGGITTVFDMPLRMYVEDRSSLALKVDEGLRSSYINFAVHAGMMNEDNIGRVRELRDGGVKGFKLFTCRPFRPREEGTFARVIREVGRVGGVTFIHAEDDALLEYLLTEFRRANRGDPLAHHESRPPEAEAIAVRKVAILAKFIGARIHVAHISSAMGAEEVERAKGEGVKLTAETCPHYLYFSLKDVERWGNYLKMNPSLKSRSDVEALWRYLASGVIDAVASDHAPAPRDEKEVGVWDAWGGIPSIETMFPLIYTIGFKKLELISLERYVEVTSENPARIFNLYPRKGLIQVGSDADIALIDPEMCFKVSPDRLHHKVDWTPFEGLELCGWPRHVLANGKVLIRDRELIEECRSPRYLSIK
ncbi:MAG: amidohydrolase [Desulfurococcales archaeon ex4484_204]|nr:MAG: amidohydrolase [Desulfurococcales archaeon ex4484_204]